MLHLAADENMPPVPVSSLAETMNISPDYLMQLFVKMRRAGLVKSIRGPKGGFLLTKHPTKITVGDIVRAVEGPLPITDCLIGAGCLPRGQKKAGAKNCPHKNNCDARLVWERLSREIESLLDSMNLYEIITDGRRRRGMN